MGKVKEDIALKSLKRGLDLILGALSVNVLKKISKLLDGKYRAPRGTATKTG